MSRAEQGLHLDLGRVRAVRRDNGEKTNISRVFLVEQDACIEVVKMWDEFVKALGQKKLILAHWCDEEEVEKDVKARTRGEMGAAKSLCTPFRVCKSSWAKETDLSSLKPKAQLLPFRGPSGEEDNPSDYQVPGFCYL
ncbi:hypothetical protein GOBAR_DD03419 [Gossypium barbadense]|nr:hypothetical protein GOBAR_DD03419 [Gossypium barbadense]